MNISYGPKEQGKFRVRAYRMRDQKRTHIEPVAIIFGDIEGKADVPIRIHDQCFTSEVIGTLMICCVE
jgi:GTP cyclohydrolase II